MIAFSGLITTETDFEFLNLYLLHVVLQSVLRRIPFLRFVKPFDVSEFTIYLTVTTCLLGCVQATETDWLTE